MAEYRELPRVFGYVRKLQEKGKRPRGIDIPKTFTFGHGHIKFFSDKLKYVESRYKSLVSELKSRGYNITFAETDNLTEGLDVYWFGDYIPSEDEINLSKQRIAEKVAQKPEWYRKTTKT